MAAPLGREQRAQPSRGDQLKIAVTGAAGNIGARLVADLRRDHDVVAIDLRDAEMLVDVCDFDALKKALAGCEAVVHLGGIASNEAPWQPIFAVNIGGTYNVFETARQNGCNRVVFASSNHAIGGYEVEFEKPALYRGRTGHLIDAESPVRPDGFYGVSKVFGEALGRYYSDFFGMRVGCIRIGSVTATDTPEGGGATLGYLNVSHDVLMERLKTTWMSHRDLARLIRTILASEVRFGIVYGIGDNPNRFFDLEAGRALYGFWPLDSAVPRDAQS
jgi:NAD+ dependent glucose-6-phosphate dehydrogenase